MKVHKITVCGGGNGAQTLVPIAAHNLGCPVNVYAPFADEAERLRVGVAIHGGLEVTGAVRAKAWPRRVSADAAQVIPGSDVVVLVLPAFAHESTLREIAPFLDEGAWVGAMPARGGFDYCAAHVLAEQGREDVGLFGLQTLPWACRIREYGQVVHVLGVKDAVDAAARPAARIGQIAPLLERMLGLPIGAAANMLAMTSDEMNYQTFNVGSGHPVTIQEVAETQRNLLGSDSELDITGNFRAGDIRHCVADISHLRHHGFTPKYSFADGMVDLVNWQREQDAVDQFEDAREELSSRGLS